MLNLRWLARLLNPAMAALWRLGEFYNSHIEGTQPWKFWQKRG